jgi:sirohydrochlorin ferrochelatase
MRSSAVAAVLLSALSAACGGMSAPPAEPAAATEPPAPAPGGTRGILVMAHGGSPEWNAQVEGAIEPLRARWAVEVSYGMAVASSIEAAVAKLEARGVNEIAVVRLFVSGESWREETRYILGLRPDLPPEQIAAHAAMGHGKPHGKPGQKAGAHGAGHGAHGAGHGAHGAGHGAGHGAHGAGHGAHGAHGAGHGGHGGHKMEAPRPIARRARVAMSHDGLGDSALIDQVLVDRVRALSRDPASETVLVIAHGPGDDAEDGRWIAWMKQRLAGLSTVGAFRAVEVATLREDWPDKRAAAEKNIRAIVARGSAGGGKVVVVPFRVAGFGPYADVLAGLDYVSDGKGFLPHPNITRWIEETAETLLAPSARR